MHRRIHSFTVVLWHFTDWRRKQTIFEDDVTDGLLRRLQEHVSQLSHVQRATLPDPKLDQAHRP